ncbi:MAG: hypothetical protein HY671_03685 [Chloroflexi bacterium]|nr:hypothetical protein [Chloroflexota bacterium]
MIVADASALIALAKIRKLRPLKRLYGQVAVGPQVKIEVIDQGREISAPEIRIVEIGLEESWIRQVRLMFREKRLVERILNSTHLHQGEAETLAIAASRKLPAIVDEKEARVMAEAMDIEHVGAAGVLLEAYVKEHMNYDELEEAVRDLGKATWLSPDVIADILKTARDVRR